MKKLLVFLFVLSVLITSAFAIDLYVDGRKLAPDIPPVLVNNSTLVPMRTIFEALNVPVKWDANTQTVTATKGNTTISITIGKSVAYINGNATTLNAPAQLMQGRTMVPVRFVSESLAADVFWDAYAGGTVYVSTVPNYDGYRSIPDNLYYTTANKNGFSDVYMFEDGEVAKIIISDKKDEDDLCIIKTSSGFIGVAKDLKSNAWKDLKVGDRIRLCFQYIETKPDDDLVIGYFMELGDISIKPSDPAVNAAKAKLDAAMNEIKNKCKDMPNLSYLEVIKAPTEEKIKVSISFNYPSKPTPLEFQALLSQIIPDVTNIATKHSVLIYSLKISAQKNNVTTVYWQSYNTGGSNDNNAIATGDMFDNTDNYATQKVFFTNVESTMKKWLEREDGSVRGLGLTMSGYKAILNGMSLSDVERIIGFGGEILATSSSGSHTASIYSWEDEFKVITVAFLDDAVTSKAQAGLE